MHSTAPFAPRLGTLLAVGAARTFEASVRALYLHLAHETPRGDAAVLVRRLAARALITPEAALYLLAFAGALGGARAGLPALAFERFGASARRRLSAGAAFRFK